MMRFPLSEGLALTSRLIVHARRLVSFVLLFLTLASLVTLYEVTGEDPYPAGADQVRVRGEVLDPAYDPARWHTLSVGHNSRTGLSTATAWALTRLQWEEPYQKTIPLALQVGLVKEEQVQLGAESVAVARSIVLDFLGRSPAAEFSTSKKWTVGPSGGLVLALAFLDSQTEGDLSGGLVISGTGVLDPVSEVGRVEPIIGLEEKLDSAEWVKSDLVFVPYEDDTREGTVLSETYSMLGVFDFLALPAVTQQAMLERPGPLVIRVPSFAVAVEALQALGGECHCGLETEPREPDPTTGPPDHLS